MPARFRIEDPTLAGALRKIEQLVRRAGGRTWLVGGSVRDLVLGQQPRDLDLEVTGVTPGQIHALLTEHFSVNSSGKRSRSSSCKAYRSICPFPPAHSPTTPLSLAC